VRVRGGLARPYPSADVTDHLADSQKWAANAREVFDILGVTRQPA